MLNFLFWNANGKPISQMAASLVAQREVDVLMLTEHERVDFSELMGNLNDEGIKFYPSSATLDRIAMFTRFDPSFLALATDYAKSDRMVVFHLTLPYRTDIILGAVHLPSKVYWSEQEQSQLATRYSNEIREVELLAGHTRTVLVGDFNMNPFEDGMTGSETFHAVMDRGIALRGARVVNGEERRYFYNPMWGRMGDLSLGPPGTYYYGDSTPITYFWNTFDQVLIRPSLIDCFVNDKLSVITEVNSQSLLNDNGLPDRNIGSDHLPLMFSLDL